MGCFIKDSANSHAIYSHPPVAPCLYRYMSPSPPLIGVVSWLFWSLPVRTIHSTKLYSILPVGMSQECTGEIHSWLGCGVQTTSESSLALFLLGMERATMMRIRVQLLSWGRGSHLFNLLLCISYCCTLFSASLWQGKFFPALSADLSCWQQYDSA